MKLWGRKTTFISELKSLGDIPEPIVESWDVLSGSIFPWMLFERHSGKCDCSYCTSFGQASIGFSWPRCKSKNAWRIFHFQKNKYNFYFRWTLGMQWRNLIPRRYPKPEVAQSGNSGEFSQQAN